MKTRLKIKRFFFESFRPRTWDDYAEIFTRGIKEREGDNAVYPWLWLRVLCVLLITYTVYAVVNASMPGAGDREVFYFVGGAFLDTAFLVLLFELYPKKDFPLITVLCVCVLGGTASDFISAFIYHFHSMEVLLNGWKLAVIAGVTEEIAKGIPAVLCVIALKKKDPSAGFLIGACVGTWFSITENASYIHGGSIGMMVLTATARAFGCMFSHAVWTALITRAFCKYGLKSYKFYLTVLVNMALHFCIDMPLEDYIVLLFAEASICGLCAFIWGAYAVTKDRRNIPRPPLDTYAPCAVRKNAVAMSAFFAVTCSALLVFAGLYSPVYKEVRSFGAEEFKTFAHNGYEIAPDKERVFDEEGENYFAQYEKGVLTSAQQQEGSGELSYLYCYRLLPSLDENGQPITEEKDGETVPVKEMKLIRVDVLISADGNEERYYQNTVVSHTLDFEFYEINPELSEGSLDFSDGEIKFIKTHGGWDLKTVVSFSVCAVCALGWATAYIIMKKKNRHEQLKPAQ